MIGELLEVGNRVDPEEVLVGLLVWQVEFADIGLSQNGLEDVILVGVIDNVLEHLMGVTKPAQLIVVGLEVAIHQQSVDAHTDGVLSNECDLVLHLIFNHLQGRRKRNERERVIQNR